MQTSSLAFSLAGNFEAGNAILAGAIGAMAMLLVIYGGRAMGVTSMDLLRTLGSMVAPGATRSVTYGIGLMMHLMMGAMFGLIEVGLLHAANPSSEGAAAGLDVLFGLALGAMVAIGMPLLLTMTHPLVRSGDLPAPGFAMTGFGRRTPAGLVMAHVVFSLVAGGIYAAAVG